MSAWSLLEDRPGERGGTMLHHTSTLLHISNEQQVCTDSKTDGQVQSCNSKCQRSMQVIDM